MKQRKIFYAYVDGKLVHIDKVSDKSGKFLCAGCGGILIAKQGEEKTWHFAHKDKSCALQSLDDGANLKLDGLPEKDLADVEVPEDPVFFMCSKCSKKERKELGIRWDKKEWICRTCFKEL